MSSLTTADHEHMAHALRLAQRGLYTTAPNPRVGCVLVRDDVVIGAGWHARAGGPHAEVVALNDAKAKGNDARGATAYVTLEPCHHHGRTPPCDVALVEAGVARVVIAMQDPDPRTAGQGIAHLRKAGVLVDVGIGEMEARELNIGFVSRLTRGRPWVRVKIAASLDGKTALNNGESQWITGEAARLDGQHWRARASAILTGSGTVKADDPRLTVRDIELPRDIEGLQTLHQPLRVIVDSHLTIPLSSRVLGGDALVVCVDDKTPAADALRAHGAEVIALPNVNGKVDLPALLNALAKRDINEAHVEAGATLNGALLNAGLVDELVIYLAPTLLGDAARGMFALPALQDLDARKPLTIRDMRMVGADLRIIARLG